MACDSVEQSGKQIIKTCFILHESSENLLVRDQLMILATYAKQWKPTFTAGGFFDVNQSCISSIFSAIITYLVIIIQFNMVLVDDGPYSLTINSTMATIQSTTLLLN
ncbi:hypothetical protein JTB14_029678 [Gonioctena quinquepunctata]|nr:hypothetical protein JTB14_029678 [Gonioctena quinquepunctata]